MSYKVIWFDDEYKDRKRILESAHLKGVKLIGFGNAEEGIAELEMNIEAYDAALLDGIFYETASESGKATQDVAMGKVAKTLLRLESRKKLPWFILSGQDSFTKEKNKYAAAFKDGKVFDKLGGEQEYEDLWNQLISEASKLPETQARHQNRKLFEIFEKGNLPIEVEDQVLRLILSPLPSNDNELKGMLSSIRSIYESCFIELESIRVVPNSNESFSKIIKHLSGNKVWDSDKRTLVPTTVEYQKVEIENLGKWIYFTCGTYLHNLKEQHYDGYTISNYAVESLRSGLYEILLWFDKTYSEHK